MRKLFITLLLNLVLLTMVFADGTQPSGSGTSGDPYLVTNLDNLIWISTNSGSWGVYFQQNANIDAGNTAVMNSNGSGGYYGFSPIGNSTTPFTGTYDGQDYRISNMYINRTSNNDRGLFGYVNGATLQNLEVKDAYVSGADNVGALAGSATGSTVITNCISSGDVDGDYNTGGLVGIVASSTTLTNCSSNADITGSYNKIGGLVGSNEGEINTSFAKGDVAGNSRVGGLAGYSSGTINNCYAAVGAVSGLTYIGGLLGRNIGGTVNYCFAAGSVSGTSDLGGLMGYNDGTVNKCCYDSEVTGQTDTDKGSPKSTDMMKTYITFYFNEWDFENESRNGSADVWDMDFSGGTNNGYPYIAWQDGSTVSLPNEPAQPAGDGSSGNPYQITSLQNLIWVCFNPDQWTLTTYFEQTADIDAFNASSWNGVAGFPPIGGTNGVSFQGSYNGQYYRISNVYMKYSDKNNVGVFGKTFCARIKKLGVINVNITGNNYVGALVGNKSGGGTYSIGTASNCFSTGVVNGDGYVGGLIGETDIFCEITNCYSTVSVSGDYAGGLVGDNGGVIFKSYAKGDVNGYQKVGGMAGITDNNIKNSYATGSISGTSDVGGFIGEYNSGVVSYCYAAGSVTGSTNVGGFVGVKDGSSISACFYDSDVSGQSDTKATPKTTAEMKDFATFLNAGWDYVSETANGSNDNWDQDCTGSTNSGYPFLSWVDGSSVTLTFLPESPANGDGSSGDPYQIASLANLYWISLNSAEWDKYYIQTAEIDASGSATLECGAGIPPIGNATTQFTGSYNGQEHTIDGLFIDLDSDDYVGLFGYTDGASIQKLGVTGCNITGANYVGGIVGRNNDNSLVSRCFTGGSITATSNAGGITGRNNTSSTIINCYSRASVNCTSSTGGLIGTNHSDSEIIKCYARGSVTGTTDVGGLVGINTGTVTDCFYDQETTGQSDNSGKGTPCTSLEMKTLNTFFQAGWDLEVETANGTVNIWDMDHTGSVAGCYPYLSWKDGSSVSIPSKPAAGDGTSGDPYHIASLDDLTWLSLFTAKWSKSCIQTADIDASATSSWLSNAGFSPIGNATTLFTGSYDGQGHTISNLNINRSAINYIALFGYTDGSTIQNLGLTGCNIIGSQYVGGIAGRNNNASVIKSSYTSGSVTGSLNVGGIAGRSNTNSIISNCYSKAGIICTNTAGGLVGSNYSDSEVRYCYSTGTVTMGSNTGGLVGENSGTVTNSFYNAETSGQIDTGKGTGIMSILMQTLETFTVSNWDFEMEETNGTNDYWDMDCTCSINNGFPFLSWQNGGDTALPVELAAFTARSENRAIVLDWTTASETVNLGFILERCTETGDWQQISSYKLCESLCGQGTSVTETDYSYTDEMVTSGHTFTYRLSDVNTNGVVNILSTVTVEMIVVPTRTQLCPAYPNPFNPSTTIRYELAKDGYVSITVFDVLGKQVKSLYDGEQSVGSYELHWSGLDERDNQVSSGIYLVRMRAGTVTQTQKVMFVK